MRAEDQLVLLLARGSIPETVERQVNSIMDAGVRWSEFLTRAIQESVHPLVYQNLKRLAPGRVPEDIVSHFRALHKANTLRNALLGAELEAVLVALRDAAIRVIPLKGLPLTKALYGDASLRVCDDIDLLVPRASLINALDVLTSQGYNSEFKKPFRDSLIMRRGIECALTRKTGTFTYLLELHWGLFLDASMEERILQDLWSDSVSNSFEGVQHQALSPEWEMLFLCVHAARHHWRGLKWMVDVQEICSRGRIDWSKLQTIAERCEWERVLGLTLFAIHELFGTAVPISFELNARPSWLCLYPDTLDAKKFPAFYFHASLFVPRSQRLLYSIRAFFVPSINEQRLVNLPAAMSFLYYPIRLARLSWLIGCYSFRSGFQWIKARCAAVF